VRVLIVGCGYAGLPLGAKLARQGHEVVGVRRSAAGAEALTAAGIVPCAADITRAEDLARLPGPFDWVVNTVSSGKGGEQAYRDVFVRGTENLIRWLAPTPLKKFVFTSSTSVYGQADGSVVDESSPAEPDSPTSRLLVEAERLVLDAARARRFPAVVLRVAGIYGPGRGHLFQQFLRGEARLTGEGRRWLNMVHRDDLVDAVIAALERGQAGEIYNVADDEPVREADFFQWLALELNRPPPPAQSVEARAGRKRGVTDKRVSNRKLRDALGWRPRFPSYREGYARWREWQGAS
jgi:nucleoside-diphosphate-sugar epimerase